MSLSRRSFLRRSAAAAAVLPFYQHLSLDLCGASPGEAVDFTMGYAPGAARLNMNENPFGPSPKAIEAVTRGLWEANRYVNPTQLRKALARLHGVEEKSILLGTGSTELLKIVPRAYFREGGNIVSTIETFRTTPEEAEREGARVRWVKHRPDWTYDTEGMLEAVNSKTKIFYLVNPNNPTGSVLGYDQLAAVAGALPKKVLFFIDEAYFHFLPGDGRNGVDLLKAGYSNVFVTRTFSKVHGLAGLRIGYGVGHPDVINKIAEYGGGLTSVNTAGFGGALAAVEDHEHIEKFIRHAREARSFYEKEISALGLRYISGASPFIMVEVGQDSKAFQEKMAQENVFVRKGEDWDLPRHIRISFGFERDNRAAIGALKKLLA